jgi:hypothetical protein
MGILSLFRSPDKHQSGVYRILNRKNGRVYIGATTQPMTLRWAQHRKQLRAGNHHNKALLEDWRRYGERAFRFIVIEAAGSDQVFARERYWQEQGYTPEGRYNPPPGWMPSRRPSPPVDFSSEEARLSLQKLYFVVRLDYSQDQARELFVRLLIPLDAVLRAENEYDPNRIDLLPQRKRKARP